MSEQVNHPQHYGGEDNPYEAIKVIDAWELGFSLGNTVKYISRAGKKDSDNNSAFAASSPWGENQVVVSYSNSVDEFIDARWDAADLAAQRVVDQCSRDLAYAGVGVLCQIQGCDTSDVG